MGTHAGFSATSTRDGDRVTVVVHGDVDVLRLGEVRRLLHDALIDGCRQLVVDLAGVTFIDSVGLGVLVATWKRARVLRVGLVLWRPSRQVASVLSLTALDRVLKVEVRDELPDLDDEPATASS